MNRESFAKILVVLLAVVLSGRAGAFQLKYLHSAGDDLDYNLTVTRDNSIASMDIRRHVDSVSSGLLTITTSFSNGTMSKGGVVEPVSGLSGPVSTTVVNRFGLVSSITPLGDFSSTLSAFGLTLERDVWSSLGISSFPTIQLSVGDTWTKSATGGLGAVNVDYEIEESGLTVAGFTSVVRISVASSFIIDKQQEIVDIRRDSYMRGNVALAGDLYFDLNAGRIVKHDLSLTYHVLTVMLTYDGETLISRDDGTTTAELLIQ